ncbi:hypothetical protein ACRJ4B_49900 [Streptomyces sp. GTA36]
MTAGRIVGAILPTLSFLAPLAAIALALTPRLGAHTMRLVNKLYRGHPVSLAALVLRIAYGGMGAFLLMCALTSAQHRSIPYACMLAAAAALFLVAIVRDTELTDERRTVAEYAAAEADRLARRDAWAASLAEEELRDACCDLWWSSTGTEHLRTCPNHPSRRQS